MADDPQNLVLEHLRYIRSRIDRIEETLADHGQRMNRLEKQGSLILHAVAGLADTDVGLQSRHDRLVSRVERIERRLDLVDDGTA